MKNKSLSGALFVILSCFILSGIFSSCENFTQGAALQEKLDKIIKKEASPYIKFSMVSDIALGTTVPAANIYSEKYKATDKEKISFTPRTDYQFLYWQSIPESAVSFVDRKSLSTEIEFLEDAEKEESVVVTPVCAERPFPVVSPNNTGEAKPKNTIVTISFDHVISNPVEDLRKIDIQIDGKSILEHYKTPVYSNGGRTILFESDDKNLLDLKAADGNRTVNVKIPEVFYYTMPDGTAVYMGEEAESSFTINYTTMDSLDLSLEVDSYAGKLNRTGNLVSYIGQEITVIYTMNAGYQFGGWNVDLREGVSGNIETKNGIVYLNETAILEVVPNGDDFDEEVFAAKGKYQIIYKVIAGATDIKISPVSYKKPEVLSVTPLNKEINPKNSPIVITFSRKMDFTSEELNSIQITSDGISLKDYFNSPVISENDSTHASEISFSAKRDNILDIPVGTKTITVTVPKSFGYKEGEEKITLSSDYVHSYIVNNTTVDKISLYFQQQGINGVLDTLSDKKLYLDETYSVHCTPNSGYIITGWLVYIQQNDISDKTNAVSKTILDYVETEDHTGISFTAKEGMTGTIIVEPVCEPKKYVKFTVVTDQGSTIPAGAIEKIYYSGEQLALSYREINDYQFTGWTLTSSSSNDISEIIKFQNSDSMETSVTIGNLTENLNVTIKAETNKRPAVSFVLPQNGEKNIVRNRTIRIVFSKPINEESLSENLHIYEGVQRVINDDLIYDKTDIKSKVSYELSETKKTLLIKLNDNELFNPSSYVSINIDKELKDTESVSFGNDYSLQFQTSNYVDSLAPKITKITAGLNSQIDGITVIDEASESDSTSPFIIVAKGEAVTTDYFKTSKNAVTKNNSTPSNQLNFYVDAGDIAGAKTVAGEDYVEGNVKSILYRITRYKTDLNGKIKIDEDFSSDTQYVPYRSKDYATDSMSVENKAFSTFGKAVGCIAIYDLDQLNDGLYRFDITTEDINGNNGFEEEYWAQHQNGYKSVFVAVDTNSLKSGNPEWIDSDNVVDSDFVFKTTDNITPAGKILRIPYTNSYFGAKNIVLSVDNCSAPLEDSSVKVRYSPDATFSASLPEIGITKSGSTITLDDYNASYAPSGYFFIEGLSLGSTHGTVDVKVKLTDKYESKVQQTDEEASEITAYNDLKAPFFKGGSAGSVNDKGLTPVDYAYSIGNANQHVWPRPGKSGVVSTEFWDSPDIRNADNVPVRWFYTNAQVDSAYVVRLNLDLDEDKRGITYYVKKHSSSLLSDAELSNISASNSLGSKYSSTVSASASWDYTFSEGTWTVVLKDSMGNISPAYTFVVIKDHEQPACNLDNNGDMRLAMTLGNMSGVTKSFDWGDGRWGDNTNQDSVYWFDYWDRWGHQTGNDWDMSTSKIYFTGKTEDITKVTLDIHLTGSATGVNYQDSAVITNKYSEAKPSRTKSGIAEYSINWAWYDYNTCNGDDFCPAYPKNTDRNNVDYRGWAGVTSRDGFADWETYTPGTDISWQIYHQWKPGIKYQRFPPLTLYLKDGCGNLTWIKADRLSMNAHWNWSWGFVHQN